MWKANERSPQQLELNKEQFQDERIVEERTIPKLSQEDIVLGLVKSDSGQETWWYISEGLKVYITDASRCLRRLAQKGKIIGTRCGKCNVWNPVEN